MSQTVDENRMDNIKMETNSANDWSFEQTKYEVHTNLLKVW